MRVLRIGVILFPFIFAAVAIAQLSAGDSCSLEALKEKILSAIVAGSDSYSICEHIDRSNTHSYVIKLIPASALPGSGDAIMARYFDVRKHSEASGVDFSLYRVRFTSKEAAIRALSRIPTGKIGTVADGKVLTSYAAQVAGNSVYIIRTQNFLDPAVRSLLESFARGEIKIL